MDNAAPFYPADFVEDCDAVQFEVPLSDKVLLDEINAARRSAATTIGTRPQAKPASKYLTWAGGEKDIPSLGIGAKALDALSAQKALERPVHGVGEAEDAPVPRLRLTVKTRPASSSGSRRWVVAEPGWTKDVGASSSRAIPHFLLFLGLVCVAGFLWFPSWQEYVLFMVSVVGCLMNSAAAEANVLHSFMELTHMARRKSGK